MKVSIVTVSFNSQNTISDTINSVLHQTYPDIEYIIVDGKSSDNTVNIIESLKDKFNGRLRFISEPDNGIYDAMNKGIKMATGEIVGLLNSDDIFASNTVIEKIADAFKTSNAQCVYGNLVIVDKNDINRVLRESNCGQYKQGSFRRGWHPPHPTFYTYKKNYDKYGYYRTGFKITADFECMMRLLEENGLPSKYIDELIVKQRVGGVSTTFFGHIRGNIETLIAFKANNKRIPLLCLPGKIFPKIINSLKRKLK